MWTETRTQNLTQVEDAAVDSGYRCAAFHPDGVILGTGTTDGLVLVWEVKQQKVRRLRA